METNEVSANARGGTEIMLAGLEARLDPELLAQFQIIPSRTRELREDKIRILWCHDLPEDPESERVLRDGGWSRFHRLVFVSNWQMQRYIERYRVPWERCTVMLNAIEPFEPVTRHGKLPVRLVYTSTPQRGLDVLRAAFDELCKTHDVALDVYSSFKLYGWEHADEPYEPLFAKLRENPRVAVHGAVPNDELRTALMRANIFAYPSTWMETSCICLMEAMSAGLVCVHPNFGALHETAGNMTMMYQWSEDKAHHAAAFTDVLRVAVDAVRRGGSAHEDRVGSQKAYADMFYNWKGRAAQWDAFLRSIAHLPREMERPAAPMFEYRSA